ncbi:GntR family transcriptional regulator [Kitasatospora sp. NPDC094028]
MTTPVSAAPDFRGIAEQLRSRIREAFYKPGQRLPAAPALGEELGCSRSMIERAVRLLAAEGLLITKVGSGAYVARILTKLVWEGDAVLARSFGPRSGARDRFEAQLRSLGLVPREHDGESREVPPADVARLLGVDPQTEATINVAHAYAAEADGAPVDLGTPIRLTRTYRPSPDRAHAAAVDYFTAHTDTRPPDSAEASFFSLDADARVHRVLHAAWDAQDRAVLVQIHILPVNLWSLAYRWPNR